MTETTARLEGGLRTKGFTRSYTGNAPRITIVTVVLNGEKYLEETIQSVLNQCYENLEYIVVDGGSKDGSIDILSKYDSQLDFWISEIDSGIYSAMNKGISLSTGDWLMFINADDYLWSPEVLEKVADQLAKLSSQTRVAYGQIMLLDSDGNFLFPIGKPWNQVKKAFKHSMSIPHPGVMHHHSLFKVHGLFDESYKCAGDYELLLRELDTKNAHFIENVIVTGMRKGGVSDRPEETLNSLKEVRRAQLKHGQFMPGRIWLFSCLRVYLRMTLWYIFGEKLTRHLLDIGRYLLCLKPIWVK